jgi:long-subunit fatty acid transport protein
VGGTVGLAFSQVELHGPFFLEAGGAAIPALLNLQGFGLAPVGSVGMQYIVDEDTVVGATWTSQTAFSNLQGGVSTTFPFAFNFDSSVRMKWPQSVAVGVMHRLCPHRRISADVIWYDWARSFNQIDVTLTPAIVPPQVIPLNWRDSTSLRLGYEWLPNDRDIYRFGYTYHASPVPNSTLNPYLDGILLHAFSLGYSRNLGRAYFNSAYQYSFGPQRHVTDSIIAGGDFNNTFMRAQAHIFMFSLLFPF